MWTPITTLVVAPVLVLVAIGIVFMVGMRTKFLPCYMPSAVSTGPSRTRAR